MKISEAISQVDSLKSNAYGQEDKLRWLSELDWRIKREIIDTHEGGGETPFYGYTGETSLETELLAPAPYDILYVRWMEAMIDYHNGELRKYGNSSAMFNSAYADFAAWYNRNVPPLKARMNYF